MSKLREQLEADMLNDSEMDDILTRLELLQEARESDHLPVSFPGSTPRGMVDHDRMSRFDLKRLKKLGIRDLATELDYEYPSFELEPALGLSPLVGSTPRTDSLSSCGPPVAVDVLWLGTAYPLDNASSWEVRLERDTHPGTDACLEVYRSMVELEWSRARLDEIL